MEKKGFETMYEVCPQTKTEMVGKTQSKISAKLELKTACKKVLSASAKCFLAGVEKAENEIKVNGRVVTRVIYIDEYDAFNSEEKSDAFSEKISIKKGMEMSGLVPSAVVLDTVIDDVAGTLVEVNNIVDFAVAAVLAKEVRYASGIQGDAEAKREKVTISLYDKMIEEKFSADDRFELDKNCSGVLGVDANAYLRDISCNENRITIKGTVAANVIAVKTGEVMQVYNSVHEFDFTKNITVAGAGIDDVVVGNITICGVSVKAENKVKPELCIEVDLAFFGRTIISKEIEHVADAICFDNHLNFTAVQIENATVLPQVASVADIESNMTMPATAPYISKVLAVSGANIKSINLVPSDGKVTIEGVLCASVVYECEEKQIHTHDAQVPFTSLVKIDGVTNQCGIQASVQPVSCNIKARRGKELLVDAKLGICVAAAAMSVIPVTSDIVAGESKVRDDSSIMIYMVRDKETLWDVAKRINVSSDVIIKQNPNCASGLSAGDKLFIYRQNVINF